MSLVGFEVCRCAQSIRFNLFKRQRPAYCTAQDELAFPSCRRTLDSSKSRIVAGEKVYRVSNSCSRQCSGKMKFA